MRAHIVIIDFDGSADQTAVAIAQAMSVIGGEPRPAPAVQHSAPEPEPPPAPANHKPPRRQPARHETNGDEVGKPLVVRGSGYQKKALELLRSRGRITLADIRALGASNPSSIAAGLLAKGVCRLGDQRGLYELTDEGASGN